MSRWCVCNLDTAVQPRCCRCFPANIPSCICHRTVCNADCHFRHPGNNSMDNQVDISHWTVWMVSAANSIRRWLWPDVIHCDTRDLECSDDSHVDTYSTDTFARIGDLCSRQCWSDDTLCIYLDYLVRMRDTIHRSSHLYPNTFDFHMAMGKLLTKKEKKENSKWEIRIQSSVYVFTFLRFYLPIWQFWRFQHKRCFGSFGDIGHSTLSDTSFVESPPLSIFFPDGQIGHSFFGLFCEKKFSLLSALIAIRDQSIVSTKHSNGFFSTRTPPLDIWVNDFRPISCVSTKVTTVKWIRVAKLMTCMRFTHLHMHHFVDDERVIIYQIVAPNYS